MISIGILPAGGNATRFRGIAKELLPVSPAECALSRAVRAMQNGGASEIYIASRHDRLPEHWRAIENTGGCHLTAKPFRRWWEFVRYIGRTVEADRYYFAMPDTVFPLDAFAREVTAEVTAGASFSISIRRLQVTPGACGSGRGRQWKASSGTPPRTTIRG
jgi:hypothetical protein